ncbi:hypothetical protein M758_UG324500 [Ceratodon purpureus]|nr:hypothetical protein M758_UG324500 [Ceratodon purpureus]
MFHVFQVFFATDKDRPTWSVVLQKEPRSRRNDDDTNKVVIGATGYSDPLITFGLNDNPTYNERAADRTDGINVSVQEVAMEDAQMEAPDATDAYNDIDHEDDDDDNNINPPVFDDMDAPRLNTDFGF